MRFHIGERGGERRGCHDRDHQRQRAQEAEGDEVAARYVVYGTHQGEFMGIAATGKQITRAGITILHFRNGKCVERWSQADTLGMLRQLGATT